MKKPKKKYNVYATPYLEAEELENCVQYPREFMGETWAVSETQAINRLADFEDAEIEMDKREEQNNE